MHIFAATIALILRFSSAQYAVRQKQVKIDDFHTARSRLYAGQFMLTNAPQGFKRRY